MRDLLPERVYEALRRQYRNVEPLDPEDFEDLRGDEDVITGAVAKTIRKAVSGSLGDITWQTRVKKLRGRGPNAPEKHTGADIIVELEVKDRDDNIIGRKGLLAQAKKGWTGADANLLEQTREMERLARDGSVVIDYGPSGCTAAIGSAVIAANGNRRMLAKDGARPFGERLAEDFLGCTVGRRDMYYDANRERLVVPGPAGIVAPRFLAGVRVRTTVEGVPSRPSGDDG